MVKNPKLTTIKRGKEKFSTQKIYAYTCTIRTVIPLGRKYGEIVWPNRGKVNLIQEKTYISEYIICTVIPLKLK